MLSVETSFYRQFPRLSSARGRMIGRPVVELLRKIVCEERINAEVTALAGVRGLDFVRQSMERLDFSYRVAPTDRLNVPTEGRCVIVANHPLGALDALALIDLVGSVRSDIKIIGNRVLRALDGLGDLLLDCEVFGDRPGGAGLRSVYRALEAEQVVILFPAGEVSRMGPAGIRDGRWASGFARFARKTGAPVLPVHIAAHNSAAFYSWSMLSKPLGTLMLPRELLAQSHQRITLTVGAPVAAETLSEHGADEGRIATAMRKHVYRLARRKPPLFTTGHSIAHPEAPLAVRDAIEAGEVLGQTSDGKRIVLLPEQPANVLMREIGRLRELAFRRVGEGTGLSRDIDAYDGHYRHIVLWNDRSLEIVGGYRLGQGSRILHERGLAGFYSTSLFDFDPNKTEFLAEAVELGRSFVHPRYWGTRSLDYLWQGIGAYLARHPEVRYLFGPVSLSAKMPEAARQRLMATHLHYFNRGSFARARNPVRLDTEIESSCRVALTGLPPQEGLHWLRRELQRLDLPFPVLYKQYVELCAPAGVVFADFSLDPSFGHCIDGLIRLDLAQLKPAKRARYIG
ncbi:GNAT family N-acyltransferase [Pseudomarimonas arenosa]|uniref:L-ornithine N(alpha)-acyltransferase n=1 Tax=Pseudomarimonas arenosa TaxID=2774145 RepID=A0AAW3ZP69_9GAMM|nr:GNAT family N-acyltransferase [Pseudomarimonas arenosa]MBD8527300.1 lysophospholipid acyltransferase family protein [Pseudomarimonas arenosa]